MSNPSDISELRAKAATPQAQDPKQRVRRTWLIKSLLDLITTNPDELVNKASVLLSAVLVGKQRTVSTYAPPSWSIHSELMGVPAVRILCDC